MPKTPDPFRPIKCHNSCHALARQLDDRWREAGLPTADYWVCYGTVLVWPDDGHPIVRLEHGANEGYSLFVTCRTTPETDGVWRQVDTDVIRFKLLCDEQRALAMHALAFRVLT